MRNILFILLFISIIGCTRLEQAAAVEIPTLQPLPAPETPTLAPAETLPTATFAPLNEPTLPPAITETPTPEAATPIPLNLSPTSSRNTRTPTPTPTITLTPTLDFTSRIQLRIASPGPLSRVISPIQFVAHIDPNYTGLTRVELIGEDGRELYRKVFRTYSNIGYFTRVDEKVNFEIKGAAEIARLQISTYDARGNMLAFNSVRLMLFAVGENQPSPNYPAQERIGLRGLKREAEISGGVLNLEGEINPINDTPVIIELFDSDGRIIGARLLQLAPADGKYQQFTTSVPYQVSERTPARLVIRQSDDRISGLAYLFSLPLFANP
jgi:hypothetical protein